MTQMVKTKNRKLLKFKIKIIEVDNELEVQINNKNVKLVLTKVAMEFQTHFLDSLKFGRTEDQQYNLGLIFTKT
jgi:hypothetical protein